MENGFAPRRKWNERTQTDALRFPAVDTALNFEFSSRLRGKTSGGMASTALFRSKSSISARFSPYLFLSFFLSFFLLFFFFFLLLSEPTGRDEQKCLSGTDFSRRKRDSNQRSLMDVGLCFRIPRHFSGLNFPPRFEMDDFYVTCSLHTKRPISHEIA